MTRMTSPVIVPSTRAERSVRRSWVLSGALLIVTAGFLGRAAWAVDEPVVPETAAVAVVPPAVVGAGVMSVDPVPFAAFSAPVELRIPAIEVSVPVTEVGLNTDGTVEVPVDFALPGWYGLGAGPGQPGSAVILGHVDSYRGPAVFYRLSSLQPGDEVEVTLANDSVVRFAVTEVATYPKTEFPADRVYGSRGDSVLALVTCGGEFDADARSYRSNVVAYASLVDDTPATASSG